MRRSLMTSIRHGLTDDEREDLLGGPTSRAAERSRVLDAYASALEHCDSLEAKGSLSGEECNAALRVLAIFGERWREACEDADRR